MLGKKTNDFTTEKFSSIIGVDAIIKGTFVTKDTTRIDGTILGNVEAKGTIIVGPKGKVEGNIQASNALIAGEVRGDMDVTERIEASASGRIIGDIQAKSLIVDENATFQGKCTMNIKNSGVVQEEAPTNPEQEL
ncbi:MAG: polymer-forming cytoskeletal protein [Lachnospiraceae bacterium]